MATKKRQTKKQRRAQQANERALAREQQHEADEAGERALAALKVRQARLKIALIAIPSVSLIAAIACFWGLESRPLTGLSLLAGVGVWILVLLGYLGAQIEPRDRNQAGSIDFGNKR